MDKKTVNVDELVKKLRAECTLPFTTLQTMREAADALEEMRRKERFYAFIWNTLGNTTMRQLIDAYNEQEEKK